MASELYMRLLQFYKSLGERDNKPKVVKMANDFIKQEENAIQKTQYQIPSSREIKFNESVGKVKCKECNKTIIEGYKVNDGEEYFCSDECLLKNYTPEQVKKMKRNSELPLTSEEYQIGVGNMYWDKFDTNEEEFTDVDDDMGEYWE